jgi:hypothetical protein
MATPVHTGRTDSCSKNLGAENMCTGAEGKMAFMLIHV